LVTFFNDYINKVEVRTAVNAKIANIAPIQSLIKAYSGNDCEKQYQIGKDLVSLASCFTGISALHAKAFDGYLTTGIHKYKNEASEMLAPLQLKQSLEKPLRVEAVKPNAEAVDGVTEVFVAGNKTADSKPIAKIKDNEIIEATLETVLDLEARRLAGEVSPPIRYKGKPNEPTEAVILADGRVTTITGRLASFLTGGNATKISAEYIYKNVEIGQIVLNKTDNITDIFVHYEGGFYTAYIENGVQNGTHNITKIANLTESQLADRIRVHLPQDNTPIRLNSCSDLASAKLFSREFPNREVYATEAIVQLHIDGGISTVARSGNSTQQWRKLKNGNDIGEAPTPVPPVGQANIDNYLRLGGLDKTQKAQYQAFLLNNQRVQDVLDGKVLTTTTDFDFLDNLANPWEVKNPPLLCVV
jgi:hypothetical protein